MIVPVSMQPSRGVGPQGLVPRGRLQRFQFADYDLAFGVREVMYKKLIEFDANNDRQFQQEQIRTFLTTVLHENESEVHYFVKNVFRYDYNNDGIIQYDQLVNFCMEQHFGEIAIQRLHRKNTYQRGKERLMNQKEFAFTIEYALKFIAVAPQQQQLQLLFQNIDNNRDGLISYEDYFRFLKEYFGSKSKAAGLVNTTSVLEELRHSEEGMDPIESNIVKKYSKYEGKENLNTSGTHSKNKTDILSNNKSHQHQPKKNDIDGLNNISNVSQNHLEKKNKPEIGGTKPELTAPSRDKQKTAQGIVLSEEQRELAEKIAKLVYLQLKAALTYYDHDQDLKLDLSNLELFLKETYKDDFRLDQNLYSNKLYSYGEGTQMVIKEHLQRVFKDRLEAEIKEDQFCQISEKVCSIARNTPLKLKYQLLFRSQNQKEQSFKGKQVKLLFQQIFKRYPKQ